MLICIMQPEDIEQVAAIEKSIFSMPWSQNSFREAIESGNAVFYVAKEEEQVCGYVGMYLLYDEGEITNVAVRQEDRGRGISKQLLRAIKEHAFKEGLERIVLEVRVSNQVAQHVYEDAGFRIEGVRKGFYDIPKEDAYIMIYKKVGE